MRKSLLFAFCAAMSVTAVSAAVVNGDGTAASPYLITSAADWNAVADEIAKLEAGTDSIIYAGANFKITNNLDFTGTTLKPWAAVKRFGGSIDGNNCTMKGYELTSKDAYIAPIVHTAYGSEISNITLAGNVTGDTIYVGGLVADNYSNLTNIVNKGTVTGKKGYVGGVAAYSGKRTTLKNCENLGTVVSLGSYMGGILGMGSYGIVMDGCFNGGTISVPVELDTKAMTDYIGGIAGYTEQSEFKDCYSKGKFNTPNSRYVGGILGYGRTYADGYKDGGYIFRFVDCNNASDIECYKNLGGIYSRTGSLTNYSLAYVENCHNWGNLTINYTGTSVNSTEGVAGIANNIGWGSVYRNCTNHGNLTAYTCNYVGGVFGTCSLAASAEIDPTSGANNTTRIVNCHNYGNITITRVEGASATAGGSFVGGIAGQINKYMSVDSCSNSGNINTVGYNVGGIVGNINSTALVPGSVTNCWNIGNITGGFGAIGGIIGDISSTARMIVVDKCWNSGEIASTGPEGKLYSNSAFDIGGVVGIATGKIENCYNTGAVKGQCRVGGVVGAPTKNYATISSCYNVGKLESLPDSCGSILGVALASNGSVWTSQNSIENCYFTNIYGYYKNDDIDTGASTGGNAESKPLNFVTMDKLCKTNISDAFTLIGDYCTPVLTSFKDQQWARFYSAAVVPASGDTYGKITKPFNLGMPDDKIVWTASDAAVSIDGNNTSFTSAINGDVVMKASYMSRTKEVTLNVNATTSSIDEIEAEDAEAVSVSYFTTDGRAVAKPAAADGAIYIVVKKLSDGTVKASKVINR